MRVLQGRLEEAERLLDGYEDLPEAVRPLVSLYLARGQTALAALFYLGRITARRRPHDFARVYHLREKMIPADVLECLAAYRWDGNIRELENFIERAVILTQGVVLQAPLHELPLLEEGAAAEPVTLKDAERAHILRILRWANGLIGPAAVRLGLPRPPPLLH